MSTITKTVYLTAYNFKHMDADAIHWSVEGYKSAPEGERLGQWAHEITLPLPALFDVRAAKVDALQAEKKRVRAEFQARITELEAQIGKLLAITNEAETA